MIKDKTIQVSGILYTIRWDLKHGELWVDFCMGPMFDKALCAHRTHFNQARRVIKAVTEETLKFANAQDDNVLVVDFKGVDKNRSKTYARILRYLHKKVSIKIEGCKIYRLDKIRRNKVRRRMSHRVTEIIYGRGKTVLSKTNLRRAIDGWTKICPIHQLEEAILYWEFKCISEKKENELNSLRSI